MCLNFRLRGPYHRAVLKQTGFHLKPRVSNHRQFKFRCCNWLLWFLLSELQFNKRIHDLRRSLADFKPSDRERYLCYASKWEENNLIHGCILCRYILGFNTLSEFKDYPAYIIRSLFWLKLSMFNDWYHKGVFLDLRSIRWCFGFFN